MFPRTTAAVAAVEAAITRADYDERDKLRSIASQAYAEELLPAILGGTWQLSARAPVIPGFPLPQTLFNHLQTHCQVPARRGRALTLDDNVALLGHPYDAFDANGMVTPWTLEAAGHMAALGVGVWVRSDLSAHLPGRTALIVGSPALFNRADAAEFGFRSLTPNEPTSPLAACGAHTAQEGVGGYLRCHQLGSPRSRLAAERRCTP